jgi:hypothetical protein
MYAHCRSDDDSAAGLAMGDVGGEVGVGVPEGVLSMLGISPTVGSAT